MKTKEIELSEQEFENELNEISEPVIIFGMSYEAGTILRYIDPIAFRCGMAEKEQVYECGVCGN